MIDILWAVLPVAIAGIIVVAVVTYAKKKFTATTIPEKNNAPTNGEIEVSRKNTQGKNFIYCLLIGMGIGMSIGLVAGIFFMKTYGILVISQGISYGISFGMLASVVIYMTYSFIKNK